VAAYQLEHKAQTQVNGESLQEFTAAVMQLAHKVPVRLPENFIQREATHAFINEGPGHETAPPHGKQEVS
jgi:hypothetical protein